MKPYSQTKDRLAGFFLVSLTLGAIVGLSYFLLMNIAYNPFSGVGGKEVFLLPRYYEKQNDLPSGVFHQWKTLLFSSLGLLGLLISAFQASRKLKFSRFLIVAYVCTFLIEAIFLSFTWNGFDHLEMQAKSINNGLWFTLQNLIQTPSFVQASGPGKIQYIFTTLGSNTSGYTLPGTTHPPAFILIAWALYQFTALFPRPALLWGFTVTAINTLNIVVISSLARSAFSTRTGKFTGLMLMCLPSVCLHFCAMIDVMGSLTFAAGLLFIVRTMTEPRSRVRFFGFMAGLFFTLAAQFTYGHSIPIAVSLVAFTWVHTISKSPANLSRFFSGLVVVPLVYFVFEFLVSDGTSFWPIRALNIARTVENGLLTRPYPLSQVANFTVMGVIGGWIYLPVAVFSFGALFHTFKWSKKNEVWGAGKRIRTLLVMILCGSILLLLAQKTVRLEVERTWHWAFIPAWALMGFVLLSTTEAVKRLLPAQRIRSGTVVFALCLFQLVTSIALAVCIQDYY